MTTKYHKIPTVFERDPENRFKTLIKGQFATPELEYLADNMWVWTEKIDGTNIRVTWHPESQNVWYQGKADTSEIPPFLLKKLEELFPVEKFEKTYPHEDLATMVLYGEGYGNKIQKFGKNYIPDDVGFILFDVRVQEWWLRRDDVHDVAKNLGIPHVPVIGKGSLWEAVYFAQRGFTSHVADTARAEGLVMRPELELFDRAGDRIICKIKERDFERQV